MELMSLTATVRTETGKGVNRRLRRDGFVPAVCYGLKKDPAHLSVVPKALLKLFKGPLGRNVVFQLDVEAQPPRTVVLQDLQVHPLRRTITHVDFLEVTPESKLEVKVPIVIEGKSSGEKLGGRVRQVVKEVAVVCQPANVPAAITLDVTNMEIGDVLYVEGVTFPEGVHPAKTGRIPLVTVRLGRETGPEDEEKAAAAEGAEGGAAAEGAAAAEGEGKGKGKGKDE